MKSVLELTKNQVDRLEPEDVITLSTGSCIYRWIEIQGGYISNVTILGTELQVLEYIRTNLKERGIINHTIEPYKIVGIPYLTKLVTYKNEGIQSILFRIVKYK